MQAPATQNIQIKVITQASAIDLKQLYREAGWLNGTSDESTGFLSELPHNSACFVGAFDKKKLVGIGRALSDSVSDAYIQDVTVLKQYRGMGIGKKIIQTLVEGLMSMGVDWIALVAEPDTPDFYRPLGFEPMEGHVAMKFKIK